MPIDDLAMQKTPVAITVQMDNIKAKNRPENQSIRPKLYRWNFGTGFWYRIFPVGSGKYK